MYKLEVVERNGEMVIAVSYDNKTIAVGDILKIGKQDDANFTEEKYALVVSIDEIKDKYGALRQVDIIIYGEPEKICLHPDFGSQWLFRVEYKHQIVSMLNHLLSQRYRARNDALRIVDLLR